MNESASQIQNQSLGVSGTRGQRRSIWKQLFNRWACEKYLQIMVVPVSGLCHIKEELVGQKTVFRFFCLLEQVNVIPEQGERKPKSVFDGLSNREEDLSVSLELVYDISESLKL